MPSEIDPIREGGCDRPVINQERGDLQPVLLEDRALLDVLADDANAFARIFLVDVTTHVNVERIAALQPLHHLAGPGRTPYLERRRSPGRPACEQQVGD